MAAADQAPAGELEVGSIQADEMGWLRAIKPWNGTGAARERFWRRRGCREAAAGEVRGRGGGGLRNVGTSFGRSSLFHVGMQYFGNKQIK
jgi:hypothetical protein